MQFLAEPPSLNPTAVPRLLDCSNGFLSLIGLTRSDVQYMPLQAMAVPGELDRVRRYVDQGHTSASKGAALPRSSQHSHWPALHASHRG